MLTAVAGVIGVTFLRQRRRKSETVNLAEGPTAVQNPPAFPPVSSEFTQAKPPNVLSTHVNPRFALLSAALGAACLIVAQASTLGSRWPVTPLVLYLIGVPLLIPMLIFYAHLWSTESAHDQAAGPTSTAKPYARKPVSWLYWSAGLFFTSASLLLSRLPFTSPLFILSWLLSIALITAALLQPPTSIGRSIQDTWLQLSQRTTRLDFMAVTGFVLLAAGLQAIALTPTTQAEVASPASGSLFIVLSIPAIYILGSTLDGRMTGLVAAGEAASGLWTLALGKMGGLHAVMACYGALVILTVFYTYRHQNRQTIVMTGLALGAGAVLSPQASYTILLLIVLAALMYLDERKTQTQKDTGVPANLLRFVRVLARIVPGLLMAAIVALPFLLHYRPASATIVYETGLSPATRFSEGLSASLLMFNLTSDPNLMHGIVYRPVFNPLVASGFVIGLLGWIVRVRNRKSHVSVLILSALVIMLLSSAAQIGPPVSYPDVQQAALALPIATMIAASGFSLILRLLVKQATNAGLSMAIVVVMAVAIYSSLDALHHYTTTALPAYERAAEAYVQSR
jgi:hypothetical protein